MKLTENEKELLQALQQCLRVLGQWHGPAGFEIYVNHAPEMLLIREVIKKYSNQ